MSKLPMRPLCNVFILHLVLYIKLKVFKSKFKIYFAFLLGVFMRKLRLVCTVQDSRISHVF